MYSRRVDADDLLELVSTLPRLALETGETLIREGQTDAAVFVLASGALDVERAGRRVARLTDPGAIVGELSLLLSSPATADVIAAEPSIVHRVDDANGLFDTYPGFGRHLAETLARRLHRVTSYLADLHRQFDDRSGTLGLVPTVLEDLLGTERPPVDSGSDREQDNPY